MNVLVTVKEYANYPLRGNDTPSVEYAPKRILVRGTIGYAEAINAAELEAGLPILDCKTDLIAPRERVDGELMILNIGD